ncbi:MAG TPA: OmpA family protein [Candidatus Sulfotelmatobacter sp.]|jgi:outer membrane protein OmpA-like peptidoglycan-associated protein|nr:OmpA family protein [Candidatus Sulfotelmatobacter sp.]
MKKQVLVTPLLSAAIVFGAFAQQPLLSAQSAGPTEQTATSAPAANAVEKEPAERASQDFWDGEEPSLGSLLFHPFASKEYVKRHVGPLRDRVNELDELNATQGQTIRDVDARAQQGIQMASTKVNLADEHTQQASSKAQMAQQTTASLNSRLNADEKMVGSIDQYQSGAQTEIRFRPGQTVLSKQSKDALDEMASQLKNQHGYIIEVQGFAASQSHAAVADSRKMADSVVRYLVLNHEIPAYRIYTIAIGDVEGKGSSRTRVEVNLLKNDVEQIAKQ